VLVIEVDAINAESLEAALARCPHVSWVAADLPFPIGKGDAELGGQLDLLPHPTLKRLLGMNSEALCHLRHWDGEEDEEERWLARKREALLKMTNEKA
jgi:hypothetical protein